MQVVSCCLMCSLKHIVGHCEKQEAGPCWPLPNTAGLLCSLLPWTNNNVWRAKCHVYLYFEIHDRPEADSISFQEQEFRAQASILESSGSQTFYSHGPFCWLLQNLMKNLKAFWGTVWPIMPHCGIFQVMSAPQPTKIRLWPSSCVTTHSLRTADPVFLAEKNNTLSLFLL